MSWLIEPERSPLSLPYEQLIGGRAIAVAFQTVMELRFGAVNARWGELRRRRLERELIKYSLLQADDDTGNDVRRTAAPLRPARTRPREQGP
jgi:predicted nucleic acid-binding protein